MDYEQIGYGLVWRPEGALAEQVVVDPASCLSCVLSRAHLRDAGPRQTRRFKRQYRRLVEQQNDQADGPKQHVTPDTTSTALAAEPQPEENMQREPRQLAASLAEAKCSNTTVQPTFDDAVIQAYVSEALRPKKRPRRLDTSSTAEGLDRPVAAETDADVAHDDDVAEQGDSGSETPLDKKLMAEMGLPSSFSKNASSQDQGPTQKGRRKRRVRDALDAEEAEQPNDVVAVASSWQLLARHDDPAWLAHWAHAQNIETDAQDEAATQLAYWRAFCAYWQQRWQVECEPRLLRTYVERVRSSLPHAHTGEDQGRLAPDQDALVGVEASFLWAKLMYGALLRQPKAGGFAQNEATYWRLRPGQYRAYALDGTMDNFVNALTAQAPGGPENGSDHDDADELCEEQAGADGSDHQGSQDAPSHDDRPDNAPAPWLQTGADLDAAGLSGKYWAQRYRLFSRYDEGVWLDRDSWFSATPEVLAMHHALRVSAVGPMVIDAFCGPGANAIQMALAGCQVLAIDLDPVKLEAARHNASIYGVEDQIDFVHGDAVSVLRQLASTNGSTRVDAVFLSPPWGGQSYLAAHQPFDLAVIEPSVSRTLAAAQGLTRNVGIFLPRKILVQDVLALVGAGEHVEIEQNVINEKIKSLTVYLGDLADLGGQV